MTIDSCKIIVRFIRQQTIQLKQNINLTSEKYLLKYLTVAFVTGPTFPGTLKSSWSILMALLFGDTPGFYCHYYYYHERRIAAIEFSKNPPTLYIKQNIVVTFLKRRSQKCFFFYNKRLWMMMMVMILMVRMILMVTSGCCYGFAGTSQPATSRRTSENWLRSSNRRWKPSNRTENPPCADRTKMMWALKS